MSESLSCPPNFFYVISHERSGTHFLINSIQLNSVLELEYLSVGEWFGPCAQGDRQPDRQFNHQFDHQFDHIEQRLGALLPDRRYILKSHCDRPLFDLKYRPGKVVYIFRDYRDMLVSYFHFLKDAHLDWARQHNPDIPTVWFSSFSDFLRQPLPDFLRWNYSLRGRFSTPLDRWLNHVVSWLTQPSDAVKVVTYNQLHCYPEDTVRQVLAFLGLPSKEQFIRPTFDNAYAVMPRKGLIGDWKTHFSPLDLDLLSPLVLEYLPLFNSFPWQIEPEASWAASGPELTLI